jgi:hypothetical protein
MCYEILLLLSFGLPKRKVALGITRRKFKKDPDTVVFLPFNIQITLKLTNNYG